MNDISIIEVLGNNYADILLEDAPYEVSDFANRITYETFGGIACVGETLGDFMESEETDGNDVYGYLLETLHGLGIKLKEEVL